MLRLRINSRTDLLHRFEHGGLIDHNTGAVDVISGPTTAATDLDNGSGTEGPRDAHGRGGSPNGTDAGRDAA